MSKKTKIKSLSLDPVTIDKLDSQAAQKTDGNVSKLVQEMLDKYLFVEDDVIPVILKVPITLKGDKEGLESWLQARFDMIVKGLC